MRSILRRKNSIQSYMRLLFAGATLIAVFVVNDYGLYFYRRTGKFLPFDLLREKQLSRSEPADLDEQPRVFYPWINYSEQIQNNTKPPVYGLFVLLNIEFSASSRKGARLIERFIDHYFDNCHQVR